MHCPLDWPNFTNNFKISIQSIKQIANVANKPEALSASYKWRETHPAQTMTGKYSMLLSNSVKAT